MGQLHLYNRVKRLGSGSVAWPGKIGTGLLCLGYSLFVVFVFSLLIRVLLDDAGVNNSDNVRNLGWLFISAVGMLLFIWRSYSAHLQATSADGGLITDRFIKAVEKLAATCDNPIPQDKSNPPDVVPDLALRLGSLHTLERISTDSLEDHVVVMETICAHVRMHANRNIPDDILNHNRVFALSDKSAEDQLSYQPTSDITTAIRIIGRRTKKQIRYGINLRFKPNLNGINLSVMALGRTDLSYCDLAYVNFPNSYLADVNLTMACLHDATFDGAGMRNTNPLCCALLKADL